MKIEAIAMAGKTNPTNGTKIDGKYAALILIFMKCILNHIYIWINCNIQKIKNQEFIGR